ncbi:hypothetical protein R6Z07M_012517 [Ovis aries]
MVFRVCICCSTSDHYRSCVLEALCVCMPSPFSHVHVCDPVDFSPPCLFPSDSPGKHTGVGCHALLQGIFPTEALNLCLYVSCNGRGWKPKNDNYQSPLPASFWCFNTSSLEEEICLPASIQSTNIDERFTGVE